MTAAAGRSWRLKAPSALPGFGIAFGYTLAYLGLIVLLPLGVLVARASGIGISGLLAIALEPRVAAALRTSFGISLAAAVIDVVFGGLVAWVLSRYRFPGRNLLDAFVDLPFALPTAVAGISFAALYSTNGRPTKTSATRMPSGVNATLMPSVASGRPNQPFAE